VSLLVLNAPLMAVDDRCHRAGWRAMRQIPGPLPPIDVLRNAVDIGLGAYRDRSEMAAADVRQAALRNGLEVERGQNIYQISEHLAALAEQIVYVVGGADSWVRPTTVALDAGHSWESRAWVGPNGLRRVVLTDRHRERTEMTWRDAGEQAVYGGLLTEIIVILGNHRDGRFHGHWAKGWKHPRNGEVRISLGIGGESSKWNQIWREDEGMKVEEWTMKMQPTMPSALRIIERVELDAGQRAAWKKLALRKIYAIEYDPEPDMQPSQCFRPSPCLFGPCSL
jgi:hypothetical protein